MASGKKYSFVPYRPSTYSPEEMIRRSEAYFRHLGGRRTVRQFSPAPVSPAVIENIVRAASTAPSGAHKQPWTFCVVSDPEIKKTIRTEAEKEEKESYERRMPEDWLEDLEPFGTDWHKPFLETAPYLIVVFKRVYEEVNGEKRNNYYVNESAGLACGFLLTAVYEAGLVALTHTPSPMKFLGDILRRPANERPFLLIPVGLPDPDTYVPDLKRKDLGEVMVRY
jgi:nitroreductase